MPSSANNGVPHPGNGTRAVRFGAFEADFHSGEVWKSGARVKLQEQPLKVLQVLVERPGDLVTREELKSRIWPEDSFGDFDHAVNVAVGKLRAALGDSADDPAFVETVPRRGYRFIAKVEGAASEAQPADATEPAVEASAPAGQGKRILLMSLGVVAGGVLVGLGVWLGRSTARPEPPEFQRLTVRHGTVYTARFAPDGRSVVYSASWDGGPTRIFSKDLKFPGERDAGLPATQLLALSSSGEMAVLHSASPIFMLDFEGTLGEVPLAGGSPRQIAENVEWADWAPDGKTLAVVRDFAGKRRLEFPLGHVLYQTGGWISHIRISPRGNEIAFLDHPAYADDRGMVSVVDLAGHERVLSTGWESEEGLAWSPDGGEVWFSATRAGLQRSLYAVDLSGSQRLVLRSPGGVTLQDVASDGKVLLTRDEQRMGMMALAPHASKEQDVSWLDWSIPVSISPDGNTLLFDEQGEQGGPTYTVAMRDIRGSPPVSLGEGMAGDLSPDGRWAVSIVSSTQLTLLPTGVGTVRRLERGNIEQYGDGVHWLPGGKQIVFPGNEAGGADRCFLQNIDGGGPRPVTPEGTRFCMVSPDGRWILAAGMAGHGPRLYAMDGGEERAIPGLLPGESIAWTSDPRFVYAYDAKGMPVKIYRLDIQGGQRQPFRELNPQDIAGVCQMSTIQFSADGLAYVYGYGQLLSELYVAQGLK
jgi:DNA-binding winged helix-turn-helix (wHTH) protein/Tol biopolymer transport system component